MSNLRIKRVKSIVQTNSFSPGDVFEIHRVEPNGSVYFFDKSGKVCKLQPNQYIIVELVKEEEDN